MHLLLIKEINRCGGLFDTEISKRITLATKEESSLVFGGSKIGPKTEARMGRVNLFSPELALRRYIVICRS